MKRLFALFLLALTLAAGPAAAEEKPVPPALLKLKEEGARIDFLGNAYGVDGWRIVGKSGKGSYAYTTPQGGLLLGILLDPQGRSVTNTQLKALKGIMDGGQSALPGAEKSSSASTKAEKLYAEIEKAAWVQTGAASAPYIYLFVNTLCDHCQLLWKDLLPAVRSGELQVRLVPFGKVDQNRETGAALLSVQDPFAAWNTFIAGDMAALGKDKIKPGMIEKIDANTALFDRWSLKGPPFTVYRRPGDSQIMVVPGRPANMMLVLADLLKG